MPDDGMRDEPAVWARTLKFRKDKYEQEKQQYDTANEKYYTAKNALSVKDQLRVEAFQEMIVAQDLMDRMDEIRSGGNMSDTEKQVYNRTKTTLHEAQEAHNAAFEAWATQVGVKIRTRGAADKELGEMNAAHDSWKSAESEYRSSGSYIDPADQKFYNGTYNLTQTDAATDDSPTLKDVIIYLNSLGGGNSTATGSGGKTTGETRPPSLPPNQASRGQFAASLFDTLGINQFSSDDAFSDAPGYVGGITSTLKDLGITKGVGEGKFGTEQPISREQAFTMVARGLGLVGSNSTLAAGASALREHGVISKSGSENDKDILDPGHIKYIIQGMDPLLDGKSNGSDLTRSQDIDRRVAIAAAGEFSTRGEFAQRLYTALGIDEHTSTGKFGDTPGAMGQITSTLKDLKITNGVGGGDFGTGEMMTRGQAFTMIARSMGLADSSDSITKASNALKNAGVIKGYANGDLGINDPLQDSHLDIVIANLPKHLKKQNSDGETVYQQIDNKIDRIVNPPAVKTEQQLAEEAALINSATEVQQAEAEVQQAEAEAKQAEAEAAEAEAELQKSEKEKNAAKAAALQDETGIGSQIPGRVVGTGKNTPRDDSIFSTDEAIDVASVKDRPGVVRRDKPTGTNSTDTPETKAVKPLAAVAASVDGVELSRDQIRNIISIVGNDSDLTRQQVSLINEMLPVDHHFSFDEMSGFVADVETEAAIEGIGGSGVADSGSGTADSTAPDNASASEGTPEIVEEESVSISHADGLDAVSDSEPIGARGLVASAAPASSVPEHEVSGDETDVMAASSPTGRSSAVPAAHQQSSGRGESVTGSDGSVTVKINRGQGLISTIQTVAGNNISARDAHQIYREHKDHFAAINGTYRMKNGEVGIRTAGELEINKDLVQNIRQSAGVSANPTKHQERGSETSAAAGSDTDWVNDKSGDSALGGTLGGFMAMNGGSGASGGLASKKINDTVG
jgi:hypothetical protein